MASKSLYSGFTFFLQNEWQYVQRVVADVGVYFEPLEKIIRNKFLPSLIRIPTTKINGEYRNLLAYSVKTGGLAIRNPIETANHVFALWRLPSGVWHLAFGL